MDKNILNPDITLTARCSACNEVVLYGREQCPYCGIELDQEKMRISAMNDFAIDQAISSANTIRAFNPAAVLFLIVSVINPYLSWARSPIRFDFAFTTICISAVILVGGWLGKHERRPSSEPEYQEAKKAVRKSFNLWLVANIVNVVVLIVIRSLIKSV
jgi:hypothetical protein